MSTGCVSCALFSRQSIEKFWSLEKSDSLHGEKLLFCFVQMSEVNTGTSF